MTIIKQYIVQALAVAANNLRLSSEKIEVVALIRQRIENSENLESDLMQLKKITEFSKLAIKVWGIYQFISGGKIDFLKISEKFREHAFSLVRELSFFLDVITPEDFFKIMEKHKELFVNKELEKKKDFQRDNFQRDNSQREVLDSEISSEEFIKTESLNLENKKNEVASTESIKEKLILEEAEKEETEEFEKFEEKILKPITSLDLFLKRLNENSYNEAELDEFEKLMIGNGNLSSKNGFRILNDMHNIFAHSIKLIKYKELMPTRYVIEGMRACLIVIVALIRNKDVDISSYLTRAELFGEKIGYTNNLKGE